MSVCSGIEAATVAWHPLGWTPVAFSEIDPFPCAVLAHHYPNIPNHGDLTRFKEWPDAAIDILVGGTPCQSFSVAGLRAGLDDPRGNLALTYLAVADRYRPKWLVWENVPGVLSSDGGRAMGSILGAMAKLGYGFAYRVLDAQYVRVDGFRRAVPQRRRRVFVVGHLGDWRGAAAVLFEREGLSGDLAPRREKGEGLTPSVIKGAAIGRRPENGPQYGEVLGDGSVYTLNCTEHHAVAYTDAGLIPYRPAGHGGWTEGVGTLTSKGGGSFCQDGGDTIMVAFAQNQRDEVRTMDAAGALAAELGMKQQTYIANRYAVRRLMPVECERLQGFPDSYTAIEFRGKPAKDGPRYKALGNSMAVNVMRWIGTRIQMAENVTMEKAV